MSFCAAFGGHASTAALLLVAMVHPIAATSSSDCECASRSELQIFQEQLRVLQTKMALVQAENVQLRQQMDALTPTTARAADSQQQVVSAVGESQVPGRRLTGGSSTYITVPAKQVHELPASHTCSNTNAAESVIQLRKVASSANVDLASVTMQDFTPSTIQTMAAPLKVVHDASCSNPPTLDLPLSTTVQTLTVPSGGTLTVGGIDVGASLTNLCSGGSC